MPWFVLLYICISLLSTLFCRFVLFCLAFCSCGSIILRQIVGIKAFSAILLELYNCTNFQLKRSK
nr:MAG TPA: hypothetical protein [Caudoviricetes sp.]